MADSIGGKKPPQTALEVPPAYVSKGPSEAAKRTFQLVLKQVAEKTAAAKQSAESAVTLGDAQPQSGWGVANPAQGDSQAGTANRAVFPQQAVLAGPVRQTPMFVKASGAPETAPREQQQDAPEPQIGYGDKPGGIPFGELHTKSPDDIRQQVNRNLDDYQKTGNPASFTGALDLAVAYRAQGGDNSGFDAINARFAPNSREGLEAKVAQRRADILYGGKGEIRALNKNGVNYGTQLYGMLRNIENSTDPEGAAYRTARGTLVDLKNDPSGIGSSKSGAFRGVMDRAGYNRLVTEANLNIAKQTAQEQEDERIKLAQMSPGDRFRYLANKALDNGMGFGAIAGITTGLATNFGRGPQPMRAPASEGNRGGKAADGLNKAALMQKSTASREKPPEAQETEFKASSKEGASQTSSKTEPDVPGRVQSRINLRTGSQAEGAGWDHVLTEHFSGKPGKSQFTMSQSDLRATLQSPQVVNAPVSRILQSAAGPRYVREVDLGREVGIDKFSGKPTSMITVLTDRYGNLVTATPGLIK
jgi:hypothetical protein